MSELVHKRRKKILRKITKIQPIAPKYKTRILRAKYKQSRKWL